MKGVVGKVKGIIFDLDGTLLDSMPAWDHVGYDFLCSQGVTPEVNIDDEVKTFSFQECADYFIREFGLSCTSEDVRNGIVAIVERRYRNEIPLKPYVKEFLEQARRDGIRLCIATATNRVLAESALKRLGVWEYFEFLITCDDVGVGKTNPVIYQTACKKLGTEVKNTVVFEDALHCAQTAKAAGFYVVAVHENTLSEEDRQQIRMVADRYIISYKELLRP